MNFSSFWLMMPSLLLAACEGPIDGCEIRSQTPLDDPNSQNVLPFTLADRMELLSPVERDVTFESTDLAGTMTHLTIEASSDGATGIHEWDTEWHPPEGGGISREDDACFDQLAGEVSISISTTNLELNEQGRGTVLAYAKDDEEVSLSMTVDGSDLMGSLSLPDGASIELSVVHRAGTITGSISIVTLMDDNGFQVGFAEPLLNWDE